MLSPSTLTRQERGTKADTLSRSLRCFESAVRPVWRAATSTQTTSWSLRPVSDSSTSAPMSFRSVRTTSRRCVAGAFLTYRFHFRSDLKSLMTRSLSDPGLPELLGFEHFMNALNPRGMDELFYQPVMRLIPRTTAGVCSGLRDRRWTASRVSFRGGRQSNGLRSRVHDDRQVPTVRKLRRIWKQ